MAGGNTPAREALCLVREGSGKGAVWRNAFNDERGAPQVGPGFAWLKRLGGRQLWRRDQTDGEREPLHHSSRALGCEIGEDHGRTGMVLGGAVRGVRPPHSAL
jgi:hypothetical protein